ncbi:Retrovirus-related Pol polyprotein from transposon 297 [Araneus ventricosus]|uniref:Retrovirus-related Pol polyprotein from transposon 297 n=1 Tax=Araneus ventricosus TaxID=182803 RepID=A0A4Y2DIC9_ARAVE|nr:Retrovirus-related Pol polyprotein from transposon 297 [Araneus ventricosus]
MLVRKRDGSYRLVADLRKLNEKTVPDNFPIPNLTEMVETLRVAKYFTSMDLTSGFHQIKMDQTHAHLTGIPTEFGLFEFMRMPFVLKNASASFQSLMSIVLAGLSELQLNSYIDDVIVASKSVQDHLQKTFGVGFSTSNYFPKRTIFEWETPETTESEQLADISLTAIERLPTEEEILREYPPYTLSIEPGDYQDDVTHESRGNNIFPSVSDGEQVTISEPVMEIKNCKVDEGEVIVFPSVSNEEQVPINELIVEVQTCDDNVREEIQDASISGEIEDIKVGNKNSENNWGSRLRPRDRSGFVKK